MIEITNDVTPISLHKENDPVRLRVERIKESQRTIADNFINIGADLAQAFLLTEWDALGLANFTAYCGQFNMSDSLGYDLIRIADLARCFPDYRDRMLDAGVGNMRLLLPHVPERAVEDQIDTLLDMANQNSWNELRKKLKEAHDTAPPGTVPLTCPYCRRTFQTSRETRIVSY